MVCQPQKLRETDSWRVGVSLSQPQGLIDGILVVGGHYYFSLGEVVEDGFEVGKVVAGGAFECRDDRVVIAEGVGQPGFLDDVGASDEFDSELEVLVLGQLYLEEASLAGPLEVVLDGGDDVRPLPIVLLLQLLRNALDGFLHVGLLSVHQDPEVILVLGKQGVRRLAGRRSGRGV